MADVTLHDEALEEFRRATDWYESRTPGVGERYADTIESTLVEIGVEPERYPRYDHEFREAPVPKFPYSVIDRALLSGDVQVIAVSHASRAPGDWRDRA